MSGAIHEPGQIQSSYQPEHETYEESVPKRFSPEDERYGHRHQHSQNCEQYFVISVQKHIIILTNIKI